MDLSRKRHECVTEITVTGFTNFVRDGCLTITGFINTILIFSNFKITFCTSLCFSEFLLRSYERREERIIVVWTKKESPCLVLVSPQRSCLALSSRHSRPISREKQTASSLIYFSPFFFFFFLFCFVFFVFHSRDGQ